MKLGWFPRAAIVLIAPLLSMVAAAQGGAASGPAQSFPATSSSSASRSRASARRPRSSTARSSPAATSIIAWRWSSPRARAQIPADEIERFRAQVLRNLIDETLQIQAAAQQEITIEQRDINEYYARFAQSFRRTPRAVQRLSAHDRLVGAVAEAPDPRRARLAAAAAPPDRAVRQRRRRRGAGGDRRGSTRERGTAEYRVAEIFMSATPETAAQVQANAARIVQQLRAGASFRPMPGNIPKPRPRRSAAISAGSAPSSCPTSSPAVVRQMPVGAVSDPIPVPGGFSIIALVDKRQILVADPRDAVLSLMQISLDLPAGTTDAQVQASGAAARPRRPEHGRLRRRGGGRADARRASSSPTTRSACASCRRRCSRCCSASASARRRRRSARRERISVLVLCGRDDPPAVASRTPTRSTAQIEEERVSRRAQRYLRDLRRDAVIDYR